MIVREFCVSLARAAYKKSLNNSPKNPCFFLILLNINTASYPRTQTVCNKSAFSC